MEHFFKFPAFVLLRVFLLVESRAIFCWHSSSSPLFHEQSCASGWKLKHFVKLERRFCDVSLINVLVRFLLKVFSSVLREMGKVTTKSNTIWKFNPSHPTAFWHEEPLISSAFSSCTRHTWKPGKAMMEFSVFMYLCLENFYERSAFSPRKKTIITYSSPSHTSRGLDFKINPTSSSWDMVGLQSFYFVLFGEP